MRIRGPTQFLTSTVVVCPADGSVSGNLSTSSSCSETYTSYSDIKPWPCCRRRCPHSIPRASKQTISRGGITIARSWPWQEELDRSCFSSHRHPSSQLVGSSPKKKNQSDRCVCWYYQCFSWVFATPTFPVIYNIYSQSNCKWKSNLIFTLISNSFSCRHDQRIGRMFSVF